MPQAWERIRERGVIEKVFRYGKPFFAVDIGLRTLPPVSDRQKVLFSVVSPKKYFPTAVERNRFRRLITAALQAQSRNPYGFTLVFFPTKKPEMLEFSHFLPQVDTLLRRILKKDHPK